MIKYKDTKIRPPDIEQVKIWGNYILLIKFIVKKAKRETYFKATRR